jgi:tRNA 2-selenouridine synthase
VFRLTGGYRSYRQHVTAFLQELSQERIPPLFVLHGMTGVGKTQILAKLRTLGEPVIDLEELACHRGSVFGAIGRQPANQRQFESGLYTYFQPQNKAPYYIIEAESKRIGHATMPDFLDEAKRRGYAIEVTAPFEQRIERTLAAYRSEDRHAFYNAIDHALTRIERRLSPDSRKLLQAAFTAQDDAKIAAVLLADYYDPMYRYGMAQYETVFEKVDATNLDEAVLAIVAIIKHVMGTIP